MLAEDKDDRFYCIGGTLPANASSYIVRQADTDLLVSLRRGDFCYVLDTRQIGKSSLMARTARQLRAEGFAVCVLDLTLIGQNLTIEQWYFGLLRRLSGSLNLIRRSSPSGATTRTSVPCNGGWRL